MKVTVMKKGTHNARLTSSGRESLSSKPKAVFMKIDPDTGEVLQEGAMRPPTLAQTLAMTDRGNMFNHGDEDDDDFDIDHDDGSLPVLAPHQEGFVEAFGFSEQQAVKILKKAGRLPPDWKPYDYATETSEPSAKKIVKKAAPSKQVPSEHETADGDDAE